MKIIIDVYDQGIAIFSSHASSHLQTCIAKHPMGYMVDRHVYIVCLAYAKHLFQILLYRDVKPEPSGGSLGLW